MLFSVIIIEKVKTSAALLVPDIMWDPAWAVIPNHFREYLTVFQEKTVFQLPSFNGNLFSERSAT